VEDQVDLLDGRSHLLHHAGVHGVERAVDTGKVEEDDLAAGLGEDAHDPVAGGLRPLRDDGDLVAEEGVEQGALAGVGPSDQGDRA
jgi:hypothetical protein